jgi:hypothetical protein
MKQFEFTLYTLFFMSAVISACAPGGSHEHETVTKCFERISQGSGITDKLILKVQFQSDSISGNLDWLPGEKDRQRGTIKGFRVNGSMYTVQYDYMGEGISNSEKQTIIFENDKAIIPRKGDFNSMDTLGLVMCR